MFEIKTSDLKVSDRSKRTSDIYEIKLIELIVIPPESPSIK